MTKRQSIVREYLSRTRDDAFVLGVSDCSTWAEGMVKALCGGDCCLRPIPVDEADDGDIAVAMLPQIGATFTVVAGGLAWARRTPRGLMRVPLSHARMALRVPCRL